MRQTAGEPPVVPQSAYLSLHTISRTLCGLYHNAFHLSQQQQQQWQKVCTSEVQKSEERSSIDKRLLHQVNVGCCRWLKLPEAVMFTLAIEIHLCRINSSLFGFHMPVTNLLEAAVLYSLMGVTWGRFPIFPHPRLESSRVLFAPLSLFAVVMSSRHD